MDYLRQQPKQPRVALEECGAMEDPLAEQILNGTLTQHYLASAIAGLTSDQQQVINYRVIQDRSLLDTARLLGKHEDAIKQLQVRALRRMRRQINLEVSPA